MEGITFTKKESDYDQVPAGIHNAKVVDVEVGETKYGMSTKLVLLTNQKDRNNALLDIWAYASGTNPTPKNKLGRWIQAIMACKSFNDIPDTLTANDLMDQLVRIKVVEYTVDDGVRTKVEEVLPFEGEDQKSGEAATQSELVFDIGSGKESPAPGAQQQDDDIPF